MSAKHTRAALMAGEDITAFSCEGVGEPHPRCAAGIIDKYFAALVEAAEAEVKRAHDVYGPLRGETSLEKALRAVKGE